MQRRSFLCDRRLSLLAVAGIAGLLAACDETGVGPITPDPTPSAPVAIAAAWQHPAPQGNDLYRLWGFADGSFVAVGEAGTVARFHAGTWRMDDVPTRTDIRGVWASAPGDIYACGFSGTLLHFDGTAWERVNSGTSEDLYAVWGTGTGDLFLAGTGGKVRRRQAGAWEEYAVAPDERMRTLCGYAPDDVYVGGSRGSLFRFDGTTWTRMTVFDDPFYNFEILDLWGPAPGQIAFAERRGIIWFDGANWGYVEAADENSFGMWGLSFQEQFLVSAGSSTHWVNGVRARHFTPTEEPLFDVWGPAVTDLYAVGRYGVAAHFDGTAWQALSQGNTNDIRDLWVNPADAIAVGERGVILRQNGSSWMEESVGTGYDLAGVWQQSGIAIAVGRYTADGLDWRQAILMNTGAQWMDAGPMGDAQRLYDVWGTDPANVYAVGWAGEILHYNGNSWSILDVGNGDAAYLKAVHGTSADNVIAVGRTDDLRALVCRFDGTSWTKVTLNDAEELSGVWVLDPANAFAVGPGGAIRRFDGTVWQRMKSPTRAPLFCAWGSGASDVYAGGLDGTLLHFDGTRWRELRPPANRSIAAISGRSSGEVYFAGDKGAVLLLGGF
jgi:hypothetical protein